MPCAKLGAAGVYADEVDAVENLGVDVSTTLPAFTESPEGYLMMLSESCMMMSHSSVTVHF